MYNLQLKNAEKKTMQGHCKNEVKSQCENSLAILNALSHRRK
jgi:hypothetical protein